MARLSDWTEEEVSQEVEGLGNLYAAYAHEFRDNVVTGDLLVEYLAADNLDELFAERRVFLRSDPGSIRDRLHEGRMLASRLSRPRSTGGARWTHLRRCHHLLAPSLAHGLLTVGEQLRLGVCVYLVGTRVEQSHGLGLDDRMSVSCSARSYPTPDDEFRKDDLFWNG